MEKRHCVYLHMAPESAGKSGPDRVFYVGKGQRYYDGRPHHNRATTRQGRNVFWHRVVKKLGGFEVEYAGFYETEEEAFQKEIEFIALYGRRDEGRGSLVNLAVGGGKMASGLHHTEATKLRISSRNRAFFSSPEGYLARQKISRGNKGVARTPEANQRMSEICKRAWADPVKRAEMRSKWTPEQRAAQSERIRLRWASAGLAGFGRSPA